MLQRILVTMTAVLLCAVLPACSGDTAGGSTSGNDATSGADVTTDSTGAEDAAQAGQDGEGSTATSDTGATSEEDAVVDPGGPPALEGYSEGACPTLTAGAQTFASGGMERDIVVTIPANPEGAGLVFMWHGFGDTAANFSAALGGPSLSANQNLVTITPAAVVDALETEKLAPFKQFASAVGPIPPTWSIIEGPELDLRLFDDLMACADEQFGLDRKRVYTVGFSQGALWSTVLVLERSEYLAAAVLWSGGLGWSGGLIELVRFAYAAPARKIPVLASSGGATDIWPNAQLKLVDFAAGTIELVDALRADGHAAVFCDHNLGHTVPFDGGQWSMEFMLSHTWTADGASDYYGHDGSGFPNYCTFPE